MIRYIDAGTARQHLTDRLMESALNNVGIKADAGEVFRDIAENRLPVWIDELQTYDVQEVRRGRWETEIITDELGCKHAYYACSLCGKASDDEYTYCPNCGAKMEDNTRNNKRDTFNHD